MLIAQHYNGDYVQIGIKEVAFPSVILSSKCLTNNCVMAVSSNLVQRVNPTSVGSIHASAYKFKVVILKQIIT